MAAKRVEMQAGKGAHESWEQWEREHAGLLQQATGAQRALLEAAVRFVEAIDAQAILLRGAAFFLLHSGMGLTPVQVGAAVGRTDRAMRTVQALSARDLLESIWGELRRHRQPKLSAEHAGPIAKYLVEHPRCTQAEVVAFLATEWKIAVDVQTLARFLKAYGLSVLRPAHPAAGAKEEPARPFCWAERASEARSS